MNTAIAIGILAFWALAATGVMIAALRSRNDARRLTNIIRKDRDDAIAVAENWRGEAMSLRKPARDGSDGNASMARALRTITGPVKPTSARTTSTSRNDSTDAMVMGSLIAPGGWSAPATDTSTSCDTSSSSSSDSGSCGGGE
jgi:hypothetical protein